MQCTKHPAVRTGLFQALAAAVLSVSGPLLLPAANAQTNPPQDRPQVQAPSSTISDDKLNAAAVAIGQVTTVRQSYDHRIAGAPPSDKQRLTNEANDAMVKAITEQGLSVDEYNSIIRTAQNDPALRQKLAQRIPHSGQ
jgi:hypothetical protein